MFSFHLPDRLLPFFFFFTLRYQPALRPRGSAASEPFLPDTPRPSSSSRLSEPVTHYLQQRTVNRENYKLLNTTNLNFTLTVNLMPACPVCTILLSTANSGTIQTCTCSILHLTICTEFTSRIPLFVMSVVYSVYYFPTFPS